MHAQAIISEALDRSPVEARILAEAKEHCKSCPDCGRFVRALAVMQRAEAPRPPAGLADRVMDSLVLEIARERAENRKPAPAAAQSPEPLAADAPASLDRVRERLRDPRARRQFAAWASAAAVVFIAAGFLAASGVRQILVPEASEESLRSGLTYDAGVGTMMAPQAESKIASDAAGATATATAPQYIVFEGTVYRLVGPSAGIDPAALESLGSVMSALGTGNAPRSRAVIGNRSDLSRIHVQDDESDNHLAFDRVTRTRNDVVYALKSRDISAFGEWPTLPTNVAAPLSEDGSPTFVEVETGIFRMAASTVDAGIAVPPGTDVADPAAGNPNWTWWEALR